MNRRCVLHLELLAPKEFFVGISVISGTKGGRRVDSIAQVEGNKRHREAGRQAALAVS